GRGIRLRNTVLSACACGEAAPYGSECISRRGASEGAPDSGSHRATATRYSTGSEIGLGLRFSVKGVLGCRASARSSGYSPRGGEAVSRELLVSRDARAHTQPHGKGEGRGTGRPASHGNYGEKERKARAGLFEMTTQRVRLVFSALAFSGLALSAASDGFPKLAHCVDQKNQACVLACLKDAPANRSPEYFALAARAYMLLGQNREALKSIAVAVQLKPGSYDYLMEQGWLYQRSGDQVSAIRSFLLASRNDPRSAAVFYELGMSFFLAKENDRATRHFNHALELDPKNDKAEFMLGVVEIWMGRLDKAKVHFASALKLQPKNANYLLHYGVLLARLNEKDMAFANMLEAEKLDPLNPLTHYQIGKLYRERGRLAQARHEFEAALRLRPNLSPALYQLGALYRSLGEEAKAREALEKFERLTQQEKTGKEDPIDENLEE